jgi:hypothetical protein
MIASGIRDPQELGGLEHRDKIVYPYQSQCARRNATSENGLLLDSVLATFCEAAWVEHML